MLSLTWIIRIMLLTVDRRPEMVIETEEVAFFIGASSRCVRPSIYSLRRSSCLKMNVFEE